MAKLNKRTTTVRAGSGPLRTAATPTLTTHEGAPAYAKDAKTELFQLAVTNMVGEDTFYEGAKARDTRYTTLVAQVAVEDPAWILGMVGWLRTEAYMRTASIVMAADAVAARVAAKLPSVPAYEIPGQTTDRGVDRCIIDAACQRPDEPGELLAYWLATYGRKVPKPVKRGLADAARRLYNERNTLKYDTASHGVRFGDVIELTHPTPAAMWQGELFKHLIDRRHGRDETPSASGLLPMFARNAEWRRNAQAARLDVGGLLDPDHITGAGLTWEDVLSALGSKVDKRRLWEAIIPEMGYMALLRNLRNFDEAGVSDEVAEGVAAILTDPGAVTRSRQLPFRFYSAYIAAPSDRWKHPLGRALDLSLANVPDLPGRTLVLVDTSGSMTWSTISARSTIQPAQAAAVLAFVLAKRCNADVWQWATTRRQFTLRKGATALSEAQRFMQGQNLCGGGTDLRQALQAYDGHDRVFVFSDMQTAYMADTIPEHVPVYAFDLQGYRGTPFTTARPNRHQLGGYTDKMMAMIPLLERGSDAGWPWQG